MNRFLALGLVSFIALNTLNCNRDPSAPQTPNKDTNKPAAEDIKSSQATPKATYELVVDYDKTLAQMIEAGRYNWENSDITDERFPVVGTGKATAKAVLVYLNKVTSTNEALAHLDQNGLRPATIAELLAFGAKFPDIQLQFPVVALGSLLVVPSGERGAAYLGGDAGERELYLDWNDFDWCGGDCRFLAVSK